MPKRLNRVDEVFKALADPTRRQVIERLVSGTATTSDLAEPFDMALPSFTQHLGVLERAGLVTSTKQGRTRIGMFAQLCDLGHRDPLRQGLHRFTRRVSTTSRPLPVRIDDSASGPTSRIPRQQRVADVGSNAEGRTPGRGEINEHLLPTRAHMPSRPTGVSARDSLGPRLPAPAVPRRVVDSTAPSSRPSSRVTLGRATARSQVVEQPNHGRFPLARTGSPLPKPLSRF